MCPIHPCLLLSIGAPHTQASPPQSASTAAPSARTASTPSAGSTKSTGGRRSPLAPPRPVSPTLPPPAAAQTPTPARRCFDQPSASVCSLIPPLFLSHLSLLACLLLCLHHLAVTLRTCCRHRLAIRRPNQLMALLSFSVSLSHAGTPETDTGQQ